MKKFSISAILVACLLLMVSPVQAASNHDLTIVFDGKEWSLSNEIVNHEGYVLVPVRTFFSNLGFHISYDDVEHVATIQKDDITIKMSAGDTSVLVNGKQVPLHTPVMVKDGRFYVHVLLMSSVFGGKVSWFEPSKIVYIASDDYEAKVEEFIKKMNETEANSFSATMKMKQAMDMMGEQISTVIDLKMDMVLDPIGMYQSMTMELDGLGEKMTTETYLTKDGYYIYESTSDQWMEIKDDLLDEILEATGAPIDPNDQLELVKKFSKDILLIEKEDSYVLYQSLSLEDMKEYLEEIYQLLNIDFAEDLLGEMQMSIDVMDTVIQIDKETLLPLSGKLYTIMSMEVEGETVKLVQEAEYTYSNYNELKEIVIPQEVIDNAIPMPDPEFE